MRSLKILLIIVTCLLTAYAIPMAIGLWAPYSLYAAIALTALGAVLCSGCIAYNLKLYFGYKNKILTASASEMLKYHENQKSAITENAEAAKRAVEKEIKSAKIYNVLLILAQVTLSAGVCMFLNRLILTTGENGNFGTSALGQFLTCTVLYLFLGLNPLATLLYLGRPDYYKNFSGDVLQPKEYPALNRLAEKAAKAVGYTGKFYLVQDLNGEGFAITDNGNARSLRIPPVMLNFLTEAEFYGILLHEFSHAASRDTRLSRRYATETERYNAERSALFRFMKNLFFMGIEIRINEQIDLFNAFTTIFREKKADDAVRQFGDPQAYIDATAKAYLYDECFRSPVRELNFEMYESETAPNDYYERKLNIFERDYRKILAQKKEILLRTLPAKSASHPTLAMRMQAMGVSDFDPDRREKEGALKDECEKYLKACSKLRADGDGWEECRKEYEERKHRMEEYERMVSSGEEPDELQKIDVMYDYYLTDQKKAVAIAEEMLQKQNFPYAALVLGIVLCEKDDTHGIELLLNAAEQSFYVFQSVGDFIGDTALRTGDEEFMEQTRNKMTEILQTQLDSVRRNIKPVRLRPSSFAPCDLREETLASLRRVFARLFGKTENCNVEIYIAKLKQHCGKNEYCVSVHLHSAKPQEVQKIHSVCSDAAYYLEKLENREEKFFLRFRQSRLHKAVKKKGVLLYP